MEENRGPESGKQDFRKTRSANGALLFRVIAVCVVLYWLLEIVIAYFKGGADAPSLTLLIVATIVLGGGAALVAVLTWKAWKADKEAAKLTEAEIAELEAQRADDENE